MGILGALGILITDLERFADHQHAQCPINPTAAPDRGNEAGRRTQHLKSWACI